MTSFTDRFGGSTVQAAQVAYRAVTLTASITTVWPQYATANNQLARLMDVTASTAGLSISLPDATMGSTGYDFFVANRGAESFSILDFASGSLSTLTAGQVRYFYMTDNTTQAGTWTSVLFGSVSSTLDASSLAGYAVHAINNTLNFAPSTSTINSNTTVALTDRAKVFVWTGSAGTLTAMLASDAGTDFVFEVRNQGTGVLTLTPSGADVIDGASTVSLQVNESCFVHSGVGNWYTVGRGRNTQFAFTQLLKTVTGGTTTLSLTEAANTVQTYSGTLTSNETLILPAYTQVYYISNQTSGAFTFTIRSPNTGTTLSLPTGQNAVVFCDGTNVINASTSVAGLSALAFASGSAASPSASFGTTNNGFYSSGTNEVALALNGIQAFKWTLAGFTSAYSFLSPTLVTPALGTPASGVMTNVTGLPLTTGVTGLLPVANGGSGTGTPAIVAGTNVTVSGTWPNQTINSSNPGGTVTSASVVTANGFQGTVATSTSTPAITLQTSVSGVLKGSGNALVAATAGTDYTTPTGAQTLDEKTLTKTPSINGGALSGFKNKLRNYQFFVNQRAVSGTVVLAAGAYGHDGWKGGASGCTYTFSTTANVTTFTISAGSLQQVVEGNWIESGTYTLEWDGTAQGKINAGSYGASGAVSASLTGGSNQTVEFGTGTLTLPVLSFGSGIGIYDEWRPYPFEEMLCQLYYEKSFPRTTAPAQNAGIAGVSVAAARASGATAVAAYIPISYKVRKRAAATQINLFNPSAANGEVRDSATGTDGSATTTYNPSDTGFSVTATGAAGWTIGAGICQIHWESIHEL